MCYNISEDYIEVPYQITLEIAQSLKTYIQLTDTFSDNETHTLFRVEPHYRYFGQSKHENSTFYTYINLSYCLRSFYYNILSQRLGINLVTKSSNCTSLKGNEIEYIYLGDTRHIAMINIIAEGATPAIAIQLAYHSDISISSHYYSNITNMIECRTYAKYKELMSGHDNFVAGSNYYPHSYATNYIELENDSRCYSSKFLHGNLEDCRNACGDNGEIRYCFNCPYFCESGLSFFLKDDDYYKTQITKDCKLLQNIIERYSRGLGYIEEIKTALMLLQNSTSNYEKYYLHKKIDKLQE